MRNHPNKCICIFTPPFYNFLQELLLPDYMHIHLFWMKASLLAKESSMTNPVPAYLTPFLSIGMFAVLATLLYGLYGALRRTTWPQTDRAKAFSSISLLLVGWFLVATLTSMAGSYSPRSGSAPTIQYGLLTPILAGVLLFRAWPLLRRTLEAVPNSWLVGAQLYRALGIIFLILYAGGRLPGLFALPAGIGDVLVGVLAPAAAIAYARSPKDAALRVRLWNLLGVTDLVVAVTMGFLTAPSPLQVAAFDRPSALIGTFPLVLIPVFAVPLSILLHLASLHKLRAEQSASSAQGTRRVASADRVIA
jgi:hypothetical protein